METRDHDMDRPEPPVGNQTRKEGHGPKNQRRQLPNAPVGAPSSVVPKTSVTQGNARRADASESPPTARVSCTNCQRRKQKCNRQWPCHLCTKRKVPSECRYPPRALLQPKAGSNVQLGERVVAQNVAIASANTARQIKNPVPTRVPDEGFEALGYASNSAFFPDLRWDDPGEPTQRLPTQTLVDSESCLQLKSALQMLSSRRDIDSLVRNFLKGANYHYYMIHPKTFVREYEAWWRDRAQARPLGLEWTCLLLMVCACSLQSLSGRLQKKMERKSGLTCQERTKEFQNMSRTLRMAIPHGRHHFYNVLQLLHSCYCFKTEALFIEAWHDLVAAVREAQELRINKETERQDVPEFQRELNRRVWCVLDTWDWQFAALQSRQLIIDRGDCDVSLPSLKLEGSSPSPFLHMKLQSGLITRLAARFGEPRSVTASADINDYQHMVEEWTREFPPEYAMGNPDRSKDERYPWILLHRHYLRTVAYAMILDPSRTHLATKINKSTGDDVLRIRRQGVKFSLSLTESLYVSVRDLWPRDAKFYYIIFSIFDTAVLHTGILLRDEEGTVERRDDLLDAIDRALYTLQRLASVNQPAEKYVSMLVQFRKKVIAKSESIEAVNARTHKRVRTEATPNQRLEALLAFLTEIDSSDVDGDEAGSSSSDESLSSEMFDDNASSHAVPRVQIHQPLEIMGPGHSRATSQPLDPPSSVMHPEGTLSAMPFLDESYLLPQPTVFREDTPQRSAPRAGQRSAEEQDFDLARAPSMEIISDPTIDAGLSGDDMMTLTEMWRWDSMEPGRFATSNAN